MTQNNNNDIASFYPESSLSSDSTKFYGELLQLTSKGPFDDSEGRIAVRAFKRGDTTYFGFLVEETDDAFLVMLPASLSKDEDGVKMTTAVAAPIARMFKSSVDIMSFPTPVQTLYYLTLTRKKLNNATGYFTTARQNQIDSLILILQTTFGLVKKTNSDIVSKTPLADTFEVPDFLVPRGTH